MAAQAGAAGLTSAGQDVVASGMGSKQGLDVNRMGLAMAFGAGGELVGRAFAPFMRKIIKDRRLVDDAGKLTATRPQTGRKEQT